MTSPDFPDPVDLTLVSLNEGDLVDAMVSAFKLRLSEVVFQEGGVEATLMESMALVMAQFLHGLNQLPRVVLDGFIALRGIERKEAVAARGQIQIQISSSSIGVRQLPKGARFRVSTQIGSDLEAVTTEDYTLNPADSLTATLNVAAAAAGEIGNEVPANTPAVMIDQYQWIESAVVSQAFTNGGDAETDAQFYPRAQAIFAAQTETLVTEQQFATKALQNDKVGRAKGFGRWDGNGNPDTIVQGHVTVAIAGPDGLNVTSQVKSDVGAQLLLYSVAGLQVHVVDFARVVMNLTVAYRLSPGYTAAQVNPRVEAELRSWLNPLTWAYTDRLTSATQFAVRLGRVDGVEDVTSVTGWQPVTGGASLPQVGTVTLNAST